MQDDVWLPQPGCLSLLSTMLVPGREVPLGGSVYREHLEQLMGVPGLPCARTSQNCSIEHFLETRKLVSLTTAGTQGRARGCRMALVAHSVGARDPKLLMLCGRGNDWYSIGTKNARQLVRKQSSEAVF